MKVTKLESRKVAWELYNEGATIELKAPSYRGAIIKYEDTKKEFYTCVEFYKTINEITDRALVNYYLVEEE